MKKIVLVLTVGLLFLTTLITLSGCGKDEMKYCSKSGCPNEAAGESLYCTEHKCKNSSCDNPNIGCIENMTNPVGDAYSYCRICLSNR